MDMKISHLAGLPLALAMLLVPPVTGAKAAGAFTGKSMEFIIGFGAGGGYDTYGRLIARHIGRHIPGNPNLVPKNMPGAGSLRAANYLYFNAPQDGTAIGILGDGLHLAQQLGTRKLKFDMREINWIGRLTNNTPVLFAWHGSPIHSTKDLLNKRMIVDAEGDTSKMNYMLLQDLVGVKMKVISGYKGSGEAMLAMERGEVHGLAMPWPVVISRYGAWAKDKKIVPVLQTGAEKHPALPNIPRMIDLAKNENDRKLFEFFAQASRIGRSVVAPARVPDDRVAILRKAFMDAVKDPKFLADATRAKLSLAVLDGKQLAALVKKDGAYPKSIVARAKAVVKRMKAKKKK